MRNTRVLAAGLVAAATLYAPAAARADRAATPPAVPPLSSCAAPELSQPLLALKDTNYYTLAPGGAFTEGTTDGWQLAGGARIIDTTQPDGTTGAVLDLPSKAQATSPPMCITTDYPTARLAVRNVTGGDGVSFDVQYLRDGAWSAPRENGKFHGPGHGEWALSSPLKVQPDKTSGWQQVRFTFVAGGKDSRFQVDDFLVDPRARF
jgi:hypothetical protein